jgi:PAS domain S-box-containing protein
MTELPEIYSADTNEWSGTRANVLLVDDNPANLLALRVILEDLGQNLVEVCSGEEALIRLRHDSFAVVLLDVQMDGLNGFETAKLIRLLEGSRHTPIIFVTAYDDDKFSAKEAYRLGAVDYLTKPLEPLILRSKVAGFIDLFQKTEQIKNQAQQLRQRDRREFEERLEQENARLKESEGRFRTVTSLAPVGIFQTDAIGNCLFVNERWCEMAGLTPEQAQGQGWVDALHREDRQRVAHEWTEAAQAGREFSSEYCFQTPQGKTTWLHGNAVSLRNDAGKVTGYIGTVTDITERRRTEVALRESERLYRAIGESIDYGVWVCDPQGRNIYASASFLRLVGLTQEQCSEFGWGSVLHPDDAERTLDAWKECVRTGGPWDIEHRFRGVDGGWHPILARGVPVRDESGEITAWAGINLDISRLKHVEDELRVADRRKDEFLATLAHELRNPLAPICNSLQILKLPQVDAAAAQQTREMIERQVQHLVRLVDDLLDVSRVMRGKIELRKESVELASVIARAVETAQPLIEAQAHRLEIDLPTESLRLDADPVRLAQVVGNLLTNAAKYTEANGRIWLTAERVGVQVALKVRDTGIGIGPDMLPHVFDLFVQADHASTKAQGGLGIGLTLVKNLVEMHGGTVEAHSGGLGNGCEFIVRLPLMGGEQPQLHDKRSGELQHQPARPSGYRLLVIDDNQDAAVSLAMLLKLQGHEVRVAHSGSAALQMMKGYAPDLVFLDIGMPGMDGYEVARRMRQMPGLEKVVLAALTGWGQEEDRRRTAEAGFNHHLVKPPEPKVLEGVLAELKRCRLGGKPEGA